MFFKRKKKSKDSHQQLMLFSKEEMSGKESPAVSSVASTASDAEEKTSEKIVEDKETAREDVKAVSETSRTISETARTASETAGNAVEEATSSIDREKPAVVIDDTGEDPFAPFIDDPKSTSERIIHEMTAAMTLLDRFSVSQIRLIAMQAAPIVQSGLDFSKIYQLPSLPGFSLSGFSMLALSYVSFKRVFPGMIDRLDQDFTKEYEMALHHYKAV